MCGRKAVGKAKSDLHRLTPIGNPRKCDREGHTDSAT